MDFMKMKWDAMTALADLEDAINALGSGETVCKNESLNLTATICFMKAMDKSKAVIDEAAKITAERGKDKW